MTLMTFLKIRQNFEREIVWEFHWIKAVMAPMPIAYIQRNISLSACHFKSLQKIYSSDRSRQMPPSSAYLTLPLNIDRYITKYKNWWEIFNVAANITLKQKSYDLWIRRMRTGMFRILGRRCKTLPWPSWWLDLKQNKLQLVFFVWVKYIAKLLIPYSVISCITLHFCLRLK